MNNMIGNYQNGNYNVSIYSDGTKIRETEEDEFIATFPECMDVKITNYCDMGCPYCHENSNKKGSHGDILNPKFIRTLKPYTELAIGGGNPLSHPDLEQFLLLLRSKRIIANVTINQQHFVDNYEYVKTLCDNKLIHGLGVSFVAATDDFINKILSIKNVVIHIINGIVSLGELSKLSNKGVKLLILGYKEFRKGTDYYSQSVELAKDQMYDALSDIAKQFKVVSFDNLALKQLDVGRLMSDDEWNEFYMGDDGQFTMYIDLVKQKFAQNSTSMVRYDLLDDIVDMFNIVR